MLSKDVRGSSSDEQPSRGLREPSVERREEYGSGECSKSDGVWEDDFGVRRFLRLSRSPLFLAFFDEDDALLVLLWSPGDVVREL
jgi:hypothetical protein